MVAEADQLVNCKRFAGRDYSTGGTSFKCRLQDQLITANPLIQIWFAPLLISLDYNLTILIVAVGIVSSLQEKTIELTPKLIVFDLVE